MLAGLMAGLRTQEVRYLGIPMYHNNRQSTKTGIPAHLAQRDIQDHGTVVPFSPR